MKTVRTGAGVAGMTAIAMLLAAPLAQARGMDYLDAYAIPASTFEVETTASGTTEESEEGDGFGVKLASMLGERLFVAGEYQSTDNEDIGAVGSGDNASIDSIRVGLGFKSSTPLYALVEYVRYEFQFSGNFAPEMNDSGFGAHIGLSYDLHEYVTLDARGGYLGVGDVDGFEYLAGLGLNIDANFGLFADYRVTRLENDDAGLEFTTEDVRAGLRFRF